MASMLVRRSAHAVRGTACQLSRTLATTAVVRRDLVQELYIREIKAYKAPPVAKDAHVGSVKTFSSPAAPQPPTLPTDFAGELAKYDAAEPGVLAERAGGGGGEVGGAKEYLMFLEEDHEKEEVHH